MSESTPNHEETSAAPSRVMASGASPKTNGRLQDRCPDGSKNGRGSKERSFANGNLVPLMFTVLSGLRVTQGARFVAQEEQVP